MSSAKAEIDGVIIAEASAWETVEGNVYFPPSSIKDKSQFLASDTTTYCPWKGEAEYYTVKVGDKSIKDAAWYYAGPYEKAKNIKDHVAFYKSKVNVTVE
ncbi:hypothetical protein PENANT_c006G09346 [Penicillium antarcticum]|uniref:DUF427 domain-containing protein n=1 Tax=Penicillium antarcticum TaxID=416450 RepID=A0A1V6QD93_9EURO|nr:uncharacterized protein N7508_009429 [Penicillium antarcticum]KAJ5294608.1 hypothetical protein N7508_009429 [Penicillium antarcticum]OQD87012.1 hypothetical protein PENANT_c006G09346 [Penicillium antarcticum]